MRCRFYTATTQKSATNLLKIKTILTIQQKRAKMNGMHKVYHFCVLDALEGLQARPRAMY